MVIANEPTSHERGGHSGPQAGHYMPLTFNQGVAASGNFVWNWKTPFPCRIVQVSADCQSQVGGTTYAISTTNGPLVAARTIPTTVEVIEPGGVIDLNAVDKANRSLAEGHVLTITWVVATNVQGAAIVVTLYATGHPTAWDSDGDSTIRIDG